MNVKTHFFSTLVFLGLSHCLHAQITEKGGNVGINNEDPPSTLTIGSGVSDNISEKGITLGNDQKIIEFIHSNYSHGYGSIIEGVDEGGGVTGLRFAVRGSSRSWTDALYIRAADPNNGRNGYVGIGWQNPQARLQVHEPSRLGLSKGASKLLFQVSGKTNNFFRKNLWLVRDATSIGYGGWETARLHDGISIDTQFKSPGQNTKTWWERDPYDDIQSWGTDTETYMTIVKGRVGIGTNKTFGYTLSVGGKIRAEEVKVYTGWADFVFAADYVLPPLSEVEQHIKQHKPLPAIPSEAEVLENGIELGVMNAKLLQKIEELTLYIIMQEKKRKVQGELIQQLLVRLEKLEMKGK